MNSSTNCYCYCYFLDPDLGPALSQHLTHALDTLSNTLSVEFQQVSTAEALFPSKENAINVGRNQNFIVCLPNKYRCHEIYLCDDTPPHIVSPLWVISSALCKNLQPMECYLPSTTKFFSGLVINLTNVANISQQQAYASCIHHYGGQVVNHPTHHCTHIVQDPLSSDTCSDIPNATATAAANAAASTSSCQINTTASEDLTRQWQLLYQSLILPPAISSTKEREARYHSCLQYTDTAAAAPIFPLHVNTSWLVKCLQRKERVSEESYTIISSVHSVTQQRDRDEASPRCVEGYGEAQLATLTLAQRALEGQYRHAAARYERLAGLNVFSANDFFLVSPQYEGALRSCLFAAISHLGGTVIKDVTSCKQGTICFFVSRDRRCVLYMHKQLLSRSIYLDFKAVTHLYIFACCDFAARLPLSPYSVCTQSNPVLKNWTALFPPLTNTKTDSTCGNIVGMDGNGIVGGCTDIIKETCLCHSLNYRGLENGGGSNCCPGLLTAVAHCFAPIYHPLPECRGVPGMSTLVISISGYSKLKTSCNRWTRTRHLLRNEKDSGNSICRKRKHPTGEEKSEEILLGAVDAEADKYASGKVYTHEQQITDLNLDDASDKSASCIFQLHNKSGRFELQHAIRACGACFVGPFLPALTTHLICASPTGPKYAAAIQYNTQSASGVEQRSPHKIHIVSENWLWQSLRLWRRQNEAFYEVLPDSSVNKVVMEITETNERELKEAEEDLQAYTSSCRSSISHCCGGSSSSVVGHKDGECDSSDQLNDIVEVVNTEMSVSLPLHQDQSPQKQLLAQHPRSQAQKYFLLGSASADKSCQAREVLEGLGAVVLTTAGGAYDYRCTHLLLWRFERTEKCLCACASGKWILCPEEYISECQSQGKLVPEEPFEWFNPTDDVKKKYHYNALKAPWLGACRRGREKALSQSPLFSKLSPVSFIASDDLRPPLTTLRRLVVAGGGRVGKEYTVDQYQKYCIDEQEQESGSSTTRGKERIYVVCSEAMQKHLELEGAICRDFLVQPSFLINPISTYDDYDEHNYSSCIDGVNDPTDNSA